MNRIFKCGALVLLVVIFFNVRVLADPLSDLQKIQNNPNNPSNQAPSNLSDEEALKQLESKRQELDASVEKLDNQIQNNMITLSRNKDKIDEIQKQIDALQLQLNEVQKKYDTAKETFNERIRGIYVGGIDSYLNVLLESGSFSDLISRFEAIRSIVKYDSQIKDKLKASLDELEVKKDNIVGKKNDIFGIKSQSDNALQQIQDDKDAQTKLIADLKAQELLLRQKLGMDSEFVGNVQKQIDDLKKLQNGQITYIPGGDYGDGNLKPDMSNAVIAFAAKFLGVPYLWGGTTPSGFDCSGLTQYVYASFGVKVGRTTYDQIKDGVQVAKENLQAGDLIFFGSWQDPHHMGIYAGNNTYIHAPKTGDVVKFSSINRPDYVTSRRVK